MPTLQTEYITILGAFAKLFSKRIWEHVKVLLIGAMPSPCERTVTAALRVMVSSGEKHFQNDHRVLNRKDNFQNPGTLMHRHPCFGRANHLRYVVYNNSTDSGIGLTHKTTPSLEVVRFHF